MPELSLTSWAGIAAAAAFVGASYRSIQGFLLWASGLVVCRIAMKDEAARAVMTTIWQKGRRSPFGLRVFGGSRSYVGPKKRVEVIGYESISATPILFWFGWVPVILRLGESGQTVHQYSGIGVVSMWFIRGTLDIDAFTERSIATFNKFSSNEESTRSHKRKRFNVFRISRRPALEGDSGAKGNAPAKSAPLSGSYDEDIQQSLLRNELRLITWKPEDLIERSNDQPPFDLYPFSADPLSVLPEIETWLKHESWFREKGVPHRRGYLLTGEPGTGKSTFVRSVAIKFDLPLYSFDLASLDNQSFISEWKQIQQNTPAIVLLEDLDGVYNQRKFIATTSKNRDTLTFDCLLNTISGVGSSEGIVLFITTNRPETIDPALGVAIDNTTKSSRPGRIDRVIHFGPMQEEQRRKLACFVLEDFPAEVEATVTAGEGETAAQFQERCAQLCLNRFWAEGVKREAEPTISSLTLKKSTTVTVSCEGYQRMKSSNFRLANTIRFR